MNQQSDSKTFAEQLAQHTRNGDLFTTENDNDIRCHACGIRCLIKNNRSGVCKVRFNQDGQLKVPFGYTAGYNCDPIEKKPFFHFMPGTNAMSFGMMGCNLHCAFCQNWHTSQAIRDAKAGGGIRPIAAEEMVDLAIRYGAKTITSTYNEPLITSEWAVEIFRHAKQKGLHTSYVSNGNGTPEVIQYLKPWLDGFKVDLKCFNPKNYQKLGGSLDSVLETIDLLHQNNFWVEIVTLVVPELNDSPEELRDIARFIASVDKNIPWHVTAFHENYKMYGVGNTKLNTLLNAGNIGKEEGLRFVYVGNVHGHAPEWENTYCPECNTLLIERCGFRISQNNVADGACPECNTIIPGVWQ
jgi:pyruvate formate lyase activating enzyme